MLPGASVVMGFQFRGQMAYRDARGEVPLQRHGVTGLHDTARVFRSSPGLGSILVRFTPAGTRSFLRLPALELRDQSVPLDAVTSPGGLARLEDELQRAATDRERVGAVETFLERIWTPGAEDRLVAGALDLIHRRRGWVRIADLADALGTSLSPLERRFKDVVGTSPKKFAGVVRLNASFDELSADPGNLTALALKMGFHDHAHFIHEFKRMTGLTPRSFLSRRSKDDFLQFDE